MSSSITHVESGFVASPSFPQKPALWTSIRETAIDLRIGRRFEDWTSIRDWTSIWVLHIYSICWCCWNVIRYKWKVTMWKSKSFLLFYSFVFNRHSLSILRGKSRYEANLCCRSAVSNFLKLFDKRENIESKPQQVDPDLLASKASVHW